MGNTQQLYGRLDMVMLDRQDKIYGSLGMHDSYLLNTVTGNPLTLAHSREGKMDDEVTDCKIYGWSKQDGDPTPENPVEIESAGMKWSTGKNLFSGFVFGGTSSRAENGIITTKEGASYIRSDHIPCEVGKHYVYNIPKGWRERQTVFCNSDKKYIGTPKLPQSFNVPEDTAYFAFQIAKTDSTPIYQADLEAVSKLVQAEQADVCTEYEPYTGGIPKLYGDKIDVEVRGKNLFDFSRLVSDGVNVMNYEKQTITVPAKTNNTGYNQTLRDLCPGITPGTYVFSMKRSNPESGAGSYFLETTKDFPIDTPIELTDELLDNHIAWYNSDTSEVENVISEIQIEKGNAVTSYEPYHEPQSLSISTPTGLSAIPVNTGGNYTDADGQQWIADYIDLKRGKYVQWIGKCNLENLSWKLNGNIFHSSEINNSKKYEWTTEIANLICSHYVCNMTAYNMNFNSDGLDNLIGMYSKGIVIKDTRFNNDVELFKKSLNGVYVYYVLDEPIERDLTPEEIQAYNNLVTYAGTTIVENDADCYMECTYKASGNE